VRKGQLIVRREESESTVDKKVWGKNIETVRVPGLTIGNLSEINTDKNINKKKAGGVEKRQCTAVGVEEGVRKLTIEAPSKVRSELF